MYDVAVLGAGISGLYLAYKILKRETKTRVVIIEKGKSAGGRVETYKDKWMTVEAGAGRIHSSHKLTLSLIREFGLGSKLVEINNDLSFVAESNSGELCSQENFVRRSLKTPPHINILKRVYAASKKETKSHLMSKTLFDYVAEVCGQKAAVEAMSSFGYTTEFLYMNALDAIELMRVIATPQKYYVLAGGLSQLISCMVEKLERMGCVIATGQKVVRINGAKTRPTEFEKYSGGMRSNSGELCSQEFAKIFCENGDSYESSRVVCTFPAKDVAGVRIDGSGEWKRIIRQSIYSGSLCRIYSQLDKWFWEAGKLTMDNDVRFIIPVDEKTGIVMISYTDGAIADRWAKLGTRDVNRRLKELIDEKMGVSIPMPKHTKVFHWSNGVGYWRVGADSSRVQKMATEGVCGVYFCGENYSAKNQQWIEGALDTAEMVFEKYSGCNT